MQSRRGARARNETGATMVEAALFGPIILSLIMGIVMAGIYFGDLTSAQWATRSGARAGAVAGADAFADYDILKEVAQATYVIPPGYIDTIIVYHADSFDDVPSPACLNGTSVPSNTVGACNVYKASDLKRPPSDFGTGGWNGDDAYRPIDRSVNGYAGTDYLGVYIKARCTCGAAVFGASNVIKSNTVVRLEAREI